MICSFWSFLCCLQPSTTTTPFLFSTFHPACHHVLAMAPIVATFDTYAVTQSVANFLNRSQALSE